MKKIFLLAVVLLLSVPVILPAREKLSFKDGKFKIVQFTDMHWDNKSPNCAQTTATIQAVLKVEQPDIALLTGDVVTASPGVEGWKAVIRIFEDAEMPFAVMMGNHDAEILPKEDIYNMLLQSPYYIGEKGPDNIKGSGNCILPVYGSKDKQQISALLYCLDSNDYPTLKEYGAYDWVHFDEIAWYRDQSTKYTQNNGGKPIPALAFFHIPLLEYNQVWGASTTLGVMNDGAVASPAINTGLFASFIEMGDVMGAFTGHDHDNDFIGIDFGIALAYGRVTGADAYGDLVRGGRVIELTEGERAFDSWIRTPSGKEYTYYYPSGLTSKDEETMTYLPAKNVKPKKQGVAYSYYEGKFKHTDQIASATKLKDGTMKNFSIAEAPVEDYFAYDFRTLIKIPEDGVYRFYTFSDDGSKLLIDGQVVVDNDGSHSARQAKGTVALKAGFHELKILYFESYMGEMLEVGISSRHIKESVIPDDMLYLPE
ncbi:PA14 domain-containing protein [Parabacteroides bouchesdurhonensis]|uniref:PA14 domain-containing protein n=1 Tax=Parabacteroides bouchesdurhonensis TaxID=1936995 RepID=UPI000E4E157F|nr:PA14 domain-containing protein [Parabacteroides bouchesdurhonensis]RHJ93037.1 metallophosphatase [Bacteroides sp. AM07-16]